jgi:hypothetical protein
MDFTATSPGQSKSAGVVKLTLAATHAWPNCRHSLFCKKWESPDIMAVTVTVIQHHLSYVA